MEWRNPTNVLRSRFHRWTINLAAIFSAAKILYSVLPWRFRQSEHNREFPIRMASLTLIYLTAIGHRGETAACHIGRCLGRLIGQQHRIRGWWSSVVNKEHSGRSRSIASKASEQRKTFQQLQTLQMKNLEKYSNVELWYQSAHLSELLIFIPIFCEFPNRTKHSTLRGS